MLELINKYLEDHGLVYLTGAEFNEVKSHIANNKKVDAIKLLREYSAGVKSVHWKLTDASECERYSFSSWVSDKGLEYKESEENVLGLYEAKSVIDFIQDNR